MSEAFRVAHTNETETAGIELVTALGGWVESQSFPFLVI